MTLQGKLWAKPDGEVALSVGVLLDVGATVSTMDPNVVRRLCQLGAEILTTDREVLVPGNAVVHPQGEIDATLMVTSSRTFISKCKAHACAAATSSGSAHTFPIPTWPQQSHSG